MSRFDGFAVGSIFLTQLLNQFDDLIARKGYQNRSEAIRDSIRNTLVEEEWEEGTYTVS